MRMLWVVCAHSPSPLATLLLTESARETPERKTNVGAHQTLTNLAINMVKSMAGFL
ncbi:hypothetical protein ES703_27021 [subsurface metagenome]